MIPVLNILLAVAVLALEEVFDPRLGEVLWAGLGLLPVAHLLTAVGRRAALKGRFRAMERIGWLVQRTPVLAYGVLVAVLGWLDQVEAWTGSEVMLEGWPGPELALALLPYVVLEVLAIDAYARLGFSDPREVARLRSLHLRMFLACVVLLVLYVLFSWAIGIPRILRVGLELVSLWYAAAVGALLVVMLFAMPLVLRRVLKTMPIPRGPVRDLLEAVGQRAGFRSRDLYVWDTGRLVPNAAIVGVLPRSRLVMFSDSLLTMVGSRELAAIFGHEIGHAAKHHVLVFTAWLLAFFVGGGVPLLEAIDGGTFGELSPEGELVAGIGAMVLVLGTWFLFFGWLSRRAELEADLYSVELLGGDPTPMIAALERVGGRLRDVAGWRHFSVGDRVHFLSRASADPAMRRGFQRRMRLLAWGGVLTGVVVLAWQGVRMTERYPSERVLVDLSMGEYAQAAERARAAGDRLDPEVGDLVRLAGEATLDGASGPRLEDLTEHLRAALERAVRDASGVGSSAGREGELPTGPEGDPDPDPSPLADALALSDLLALREVPPFADLSATLASVLDGDLSGAEELARELDEPWGDRIAVLVGGSGTDGADPPAGDQ